MNILKRIKTIKSNTMKTLYTISIILTFFLFSCNSGTNSGHPQVTFGIHEIAPWIELSDSTMETLKNRNVQLEKSPQQFVVGYISKADSMDVTIQNLRFIRTHYPVDPKQNYSAVVAVLVKSAIDNSCIKKTKANGNNVEIYFNQEGAKRWSDLTKKSIGRTVAFIIDNQIFAMPAIQSEIRNGAAIINNLENETIARRISESLNSGISD
jgi:preprotein translocase subunit SecD